MTFKPQGLLCDYIHYWKVGGDLQTSQSLASPKNILIHIGRLPPYSGEGETNKQK